MKDKPKAAFAIVAILISLAFFLLTLGATLPAMAKALLCVGVLVACGLTLSKMYKLEGWYGAFLLRSQSGLKFLDQLAQEHREAWQIFSEIGMVIGYGSFAYFLMRKRKFEWKRVLMTYGVGTVLLVLLTSIVTQLAMSVLFSLLTGGAEFAGAGTKLQATVAQIDIYKYVYVAAMVLGGLSLLTTISIVSYAALVLSAIVGAVLGNGAALAHTSPGGVPIIPGINLPLIEGVLALAIVLVVHEGMHGVVARIYKLPLKSAGLVFFGFLPFGAFVDIDEKKLFKAKKEVQNAVFVAGTAANFATSIITLALFIAFFYLIGDIHNAYTVFVARLLGLTFALNFVVAAINLVPLPLFDGFYIMKNGVKNPLVINAITGFCADRGRRSGVNGKGKIRELKSSLIWRTYRKKEKTKMRFK